MEANIKAGAAALGAVALLAAGAAQAQSNVTISGRAAAQIDMVSAKGATAGDAADLDERTRVTDIASRIRFSGKEDLGGGQRAFFWIEGNTPVDGRGGMFGNEGAEGYVGLGGGWGELMLGKRHRPFYISSLSADPWDILTLGSIDAVVYVAPLKLGAPPSGFQALNSVNYWSPDWNGLRVRGQFSAGENKTATTHATDEYSVAATYELGGLHAGLGYRHQKGTLEGSGNSLGLVATYAIQGGPKLGAIYEDHRADFTGDTLRINDWALTMSWPFGPHELRANYARDSGVKGGELSRSDTRSSHWAFGYAYHASKRTELYAQYARLKNGAAASNDFDAAVGGVAAGADPRGIALGMIHYY
ncbi:porin [Aromatoleum toluclasticum]|uniref:porin n=1 Tax=Aromatoleum toluclasticum TaxID=92003 RepID=UPI00037C74D1|nr:porin [Aromatoleum toluclasticum]